MTPTQYQKNCKLVDSAAAGSLSEVKAALAAGADVNAQDPANRSALMWAAEQGFMNICVTLIKNGADVNARSNLDDSPLIWAAYRNHGDICQLLVKNGTHVDARDKSGFTALYYAADNMHDETGKILLRAGARHDETGASVISRRIIPWVAEMDASAREAFPTGKRPTAAKCFHNHTLSDAVLDACATGQFGTLIASHLIASNKQEDRQLFLDVWDKLPLRWQHDYATLHVQFIKAGGVKPAIGHFTGRQHTSDGAMTQKGGA